MTKEQWVAAQLRLLGASEDHLSTKKYGRAAEAAVSGLSNDSKEWEASLRFLIEKSKEGTEDDLVHKERTMALGGKVLAKTALLGLLLDHSFPDSIRVVILNMYSERGRTKEQIYQVEEEQQHLSHAGFMFDSVREHVALLSSTWLNPKWRQDKSIRARVRQ